MIADVPERAQRDGVELYLENDQLKYRVKQGRLSPDLRQQLVAHKETGYICATPDLTGVLTGIRYFLESPAARDRASANSLAASARPDDDCTPAEFERRWWALFERAS